MKPAIAEVACIGIISFPSGRFYHITKRERKEVGKVTVAERLVAARGDTPRKVVATDVGISVSALTMYELGQRVPRDELKIKLADYYGMTVQALFFDPQCHVK